MTKSDKSCASDEACKLDVITFSLNPVCMKWDMNTNTLEMINAGWHYSGTGL